MCQSLNQRDVCRRIGMQQLNIIKRDCTGQTPTKDFSNLIGRPVRSIEREVCWLGLPGARDWYLILKTNDRRLRKRIQKLPFEANRLKTVG